MTEKNKMINEAANLGRKIEFWEFIRKHAMDVMTHAANKVSGYTSTQNALLSSVAPVALTPPEE